MTSPREPSRDEISSPQGGMSYSRFLAEGAIVAAALLVVGYLPTVRLGGQAAVPPMIVGCAVSTVASMMGALPIWLARHKTPQETLPATLGSIVLRLAAVVLLAVVVSVAGWVDVKPMLLWVAISYFGWLVVDVRYAKSILTPKVAA